MFDLRAFTQEKTPSAVSTRSMAALIMNITRLLIAALLCASSLHAQQSAQPLKVVFWNVEWFPGGHPNATQEEADAQIALVQPLLKALNPDIVGLEEVRDWSAGEIALAKLPDVKVQVASEFTGDDGEKTTQQLVIASRLPAVGAWWEPWQAGKKITPKRGFSFAAFQPVPGQVLLVYCVHLKSNRGELKENTAMREESVRQLLSHVAAMEKAYAKFGRVSAIVGGDFNTSLDDKKFRGEETLGLMEKAGFQSAWKNVPFDQRVTLPSTPSKNPNFPPWPDACFDYAFVKGAKIVSATVDKTEPPPSDHRPVVVEIILPSATP